MYNLFLIYKQKSLRQLLCFEMHYFSEEFWTAPETPEKIKISFRKIILKMVLN